MNLDLFRLEGNSMFPFLKGGDLLLIEKRDRLDETYRGKVVVLHLPQSQEFVAHRYLGQSVFKGDRIRVSDNSVQPEIRIFGVAHGVKTESQQDTSADFFTLHQVDQIGRHIASWSMIQARLPRGLRRIFDLPIYFLGLWARTLIEKNGRNTRG